jgi:hypothetical protein
LGTLDAMRRLALTCFVVCVVGCASAKDGGSGGPTDASSSSGNPDGHGGQGTIDAPGASAADANSCSHQPCTLAPQCGCAAGMSCDLDGANLATGGTVCRAAGAGTEATLCTADTDCKVGNSCVGGRCRDLCATDNDCKSGAGALCIIQVQFGNPPQDIPGAKVCTTDCDATSKTPAGCPATWGCHVYIETGGAMRNLTDCEPGPASGGGIGATCTSNASCQPGNDCIALTQGGVTTNQCRPSCICPNLNCNAGTCPSGGGSCHAFNPAATIGTREYGTCF